MEFNKLLSFDLDQYGELYGGYPAVVDNPLGYLEAFIYENPVIELRMADTSLLGVMFFDLTLMKGANTILSIRYSNDKVTSKYVQLSEILAAYYNQTPFGMLLSTQANYNDFSLSIEVLDEHGTSLHSESSTLRVVNAFAGVKEVYLPTELKIIAGEDAAISINPNGSFAVAATGISGGSVSLSYTVFKAFAAGEIVSVSNNDWSVVERCRIEHVENCGHIQLNWLSKEAGGWKSAAFDLVGESVEGTDGVEFVNNYTKYEGKRHEKKLRLIYRSCNWRTAAYLADIVSSDDVFYLYKDTFGNGQKVNVLIGGGSQALRNKLVDFEIIATIKEGEWL